MMRTYAFHNGAVFRAESNPTRGSLFVVHKPSGRSLYAKGIDACRLYDALHAGWSKFGFGADGDDVWQWIWVNCGFHRMASAEAA